MNLYQAYLKFKGYPAEPSKDNHMFDIYTLNTAYFGHNDRGQTMVSTLDRSVNTSEFLKDMETITYLKSLEHLRAEQLPCGLEKRIKEVLDDFCLEFDVKRIIVMDFFFVDLINGYIVPLVETIPEVEVSAADNEVEAIYYMLEAVRYFNLVNGPDEQLDIETLSDMTED